MTEKMAKVKKYDPVRSVRVSNATWNKARRRATMEDVSMSRMILLFIEGYANGMINMPKVQMVYEPPAEKDAS